MKKRILIALAVYLALAWTLAHAQTISPANPPVNSGGTQVLTPSGIGAQPFTCAVTAGVGSCSCSGATCTYIAPGHVDVGNQSRGCSELPRNAPYNIAVDAVDCLGCTVDPSSALWLARAQQDPSCTFNAPCHNLKFHPEGLIFYDNPVDGTNATATPEYMHFFYSDRSNGYQDTYFWIPLEQNWLVEGGISTYQVGAIDRHSFSMNHASCEGQEMYNVYVDFRTLTLTAGNPTTVAWTTNTVWPTPQGYQFSISGATGAWAIVNGTWPITVTGAHQGTIPVNTSALGPPTGTIVGNSIPTNVQASCPNCNAQGGQKFSPSSYAQLGGVDAASMPISATSVKMEEWYARTQAGFTDLGHAIRTTMSNTYIRSQNVWPAVGFALSNAGFQNQVRMTRGNPTTVTVVSDLNTNNYKPCTGYTFSPGCQMSVVFEAATGPWAALNGTVQAGTVVNNFTFTIPVDTTGYSGDCTISGPAYCNAAYEMQNFFPYGTTLRMKSTVDPNVVCGSSNDLTTQAPYCRVYINTIKRFGLIVADGTAAGDNWDSGAIASEFHPKVLLDASTQIKNATSIQPLESFLEAVDRSSQQVNTSLSTWLQTHTNETTVQITGGSGSASTDILLQGTTVGSDRERLTVASGGTYQMNVWVNGNANPAVTCTPDSTLTGIGTTVSGSNSLHMGTCTQITGKVRGTITCASSADASALPLYVDTTCLPAGADGELRMELGYYNGDFTDNAGHVWYGSFGTPGFNNPYMAPGWWNGLQNGSISQSGQTWSTTGGPNYQLYGYSLSSENDIKVEIEGLSPGTYSSTLYGEPGYGTTHSGQNVYDLQVQGQTLFSNQDGYVLSGNRLYHGYTTPFSATVESDGVLSVIARIRLDSIEGMSISSLSTIGSGGSPVITSTSLPNGQVGVSYNQSLTITGGTPPYSCTHTGSLPAGLTAAGTGCTVSGTPTAAGTSTPTFTAIDSIGHSSAPQAVSITITGNNPVITTLSIPDGQVGVAYSTTLAASGGVPPYRFATVFCLGAACSGTTVAGLSMSTSGTYSGIPSKAGPGSISVQVCDSMNNCSNPNKVFPIIIYDAGTLTITTVSLPNGSLNVLYSAPIYASGGQIPYGWCVEETGGGCDNGTTGALPPGSSLAVSGNSAVISGTPTSSGTFNFTVKVTDSLLNNATKPLSITIPSVTQNCAVLQGNIEIGGSVTIKCQ